MLRIKQLRLPAGHGEEELRLKLIRQLHIAEKELCGYRIVKRSLDARKKPALFYEYTLDIHLQNEQKVLKGKYGKLLAPAREESYVFPGGGTKPLEERPVIVGSGPAGLFCAFILALNGYRPLVLERGEAVEDRVKTVEAFWKGGRLNPESNVQFGEGGAGTFSDGKLNTLTKDVCGRNRFVLETFVRFGAPETILYDHKPHLGTDLLYRIVKNMRRGIEELGGEIRFLSKVTDLRVKKGRVTGVTVNGREVIGASVVILAVGHSARDTFEMLYDRGIGMEAKNFAVGMRIEHPQAAINLAQYGEENPGKDVGAADYKLTYTAGNGRGVYTFCMCPGGYVVNASSEEGRLAVNGMSYHDRNGQNANSAVIVSVGREDFEDPSPLAGLNLQRKLEEKAYQAGQGLIPVQLFGDFKAGRAGLGPGGVTPQTKGGCRFADLREIFPLNITEAFLEAMEVFGRRIRGFDRDDAVLSAVESRTSSPVRILRDERGQAGLEGLYPAGEGAGYAGGIMSAAMDGMKTAEKIAMTYIRPSRREETEARMGGEA